MAKGANEQQDPTSIFDDIEANAGNVMIGKKEDDDDLWEVTVWIDDNEIKVTDQSIARIAKTVKVWWESLDS